MLFCVAFLDGLVKRFTQWNVIVGLVLAVGGLLTAVFARKLVKAIKKTDEVENFDKLFVAFKFSGFLLVLAGLIFTIIK
ncbi:MAG TPA: hypothetical protein VIL03_01220 [Clostridia bacterium]|jgi:hypothetical protein